MFKYRKLLNPTEKPPYGSILDPTHPYSSRLLLCCMLNEYGGDTCVNLAAPGNGDIGAGVWGKRGIKIISPSVTAVKIPEDIIAPAKGSGQPRSWGLSLTITGNQENKLITDVGAFAGKELWLESHGSGSSYNLTGGVDVGNALQTGTTFSFGLYYQVIVTYDGATSRIYVNGVLIDTKTQTVNTNSGPLYFLGDDVNSYAPDAEAEYLYLWDRALTGSEVVALHAEPYAHVLIPEYWFMVDFGAGSVVSEELSIPVAMMHYNSLRRG